MRQIIALVAVGIVAGSQAALAASPYALRSSTRDTSLVKSFVAAPPLTQSFDLLLRPGAESSTDVRSQPLRPDAAAAAQLRASTVGSHPQQIAAAAAQAPDGLAGRAGAQSGAGGPVAGHQP